jgi:membrane-associated phospholipid phosphatase
VSLSVRQRRGPGDSGGCRFGAAADFPLVSGSGLDAFSKNRGDSRHNSGARRILPKHFPAHEMKDALAAPKKPTGCTVPGRREFIGWRALARRFIAIWPLKMFGVPAFIAVFFAGYFWTQRMPLFPVTTMPTTFLDRIVAFSPEALPLYLSLWVYVSLPPAFLRDLRELISYGLVAGALALVGLAFFTFLPTAIPPVRVSSSERAEFSLLKTFDAAGNACPSLHVAFAVFSGIWIERMLRAIGAPPFIRLLSALWCVGIMYSTLATKQHVALDVYAGTVLGAAFAAWTPRRLRRVVSAESDAGVGVPISR